MISLIITTYNYAHYVERAIRSAIEQSVEKNHYEIIIVNDASTDGTERILENYTPYARVFNLEKNTGLAGARNFGIKKAIGQFIVFLDADDYIHGDMLKVQKLFLEQNNKLDAVSVDYHIVDERGTHLQHVDASEHPIACGVMFRKDYLYSIGLYDESFRAREEEDLRLRWLEKYNIHNIAVPLYRYRMHGNNLTKDNEVMDIHKEKLQSKHQL
ncbi:MAG: glycosyltransferase family 2 protein [Crocinitomicaceae bacterium]|nr:glycosyltransferase family 2 protein [Crocinitomicaceae bacterium]